TTWNVSHQRNTPRDTTRQPPPRGSVFTAGKGLIRGPTASSVRVPAGLNGGRFSSKSVPNGRSTFWIVSAGKVSSPSTTHPSVSPRYPVPRTNLGHGWSPGGRCIDDISAL